MLKSLSKRVLSMGLALATAITMFPTTSRATDLPEEIEILERSEDEDIVVEEDVQEVGEEAAEDISIESVEASEEEHSETEDSAGPETITEYYVAPGYEGVYTEADIEYYFENEYEITEEEQEADFLATASDIKDALKKRMTSYTYNDSSFNAKSLIEGALVDNNETDPTGGDYIKGNLIGYNASGKGIGSNWTINITFMYASYGNAADEEKQVTQKVAAIKSELGLTSSTLSDYDKVKLIDDYLRDHVTYKNDGSNGCHGTYAALIRGSAVCQGYSTAFLRLTREAGVASKYIVGMQIDHAWNIVKVTGGTDPERPWYNNDTTWGRFLENDIEFLDHPRDKEYNTDSYKKKHPISKYNWGKTTAGIDMDNKEFNFNSVDGSPMSSTVNPEDKKPKILVFYHYGESNKSDYPAQILKSLEQHKVMKNNKIDVYAIDVNSDREAVQSYMKSNGLGSLIKFASFNKDSTDAFSYYGGYYSPHIVMIDENNRVQFSNYYAGEFITKKFAEYVWNTFMYYLVADWDHTAVIKSISLDKSTVSLQKGATDYLTVTYDPEKTCDDKTVTWSTSDDTVVEVIPEGINTATIIATGSGVATITARCMSKTATCRVTTFTPITGITLEADYTTIFNGEKTLISSVVAPKKSDVMGGYSWKVSDKDVADLTVSATGDSAYILGKKPGNTTVTVTADGKTATKEITVISSDITLDYQGGQPSGKDPTVITGTYGAPIGQLPVPTYDGHIFYGWYTGKDCTGLKVSETTRINRYELGEAFVLYAGYKAVQENQITILPIADQTYEGAALKPQVAVYGGDIRLTEGKDYTIKYSNNTNAYTLSEGQTGFNAAAAPTATVTGKGNYSGNAMATFRILPKNLSDSDIVIDASSLYLTANGKTQHAVPVINYKKTVLKAGIDFELSYPDSDAGDYVKSGQNTVVITAKSGGNYEGTKTLIQTIVRSDLEKIDKCKITVSKSYAYTGEAITPEVTVTSGKLLLTEGKDYNLILTDNVEIGTASVVVSGIGGFTGNKKFTFKITGTSLAKADVTLSQTSFTYDGSEQKPVVTVRASKSDPTLLKEGTDYTVSYVGNKNKGKATVLVKGCGKYTGTAKKTFAIAAAKMETAEVMFSNGKDVGSEQYLKGGVTPRFIVKFNGEYLKEGTDYTVKISGNDQVFTYTGDAKKAPTVTLSGKGNFAGKKKAFFTIGPANLIKRDGAYVVLDDVAYTGKAGKWKSQPAIYDGNGKKLTAGKDYDKNIKYTYLDPDTLEDTGVEVEASATPEIGKVIGASITGIGNYAGTKFEPKYCNYMIIDGSKHIGKGVTFKVADQVYTGKEVFITKDDISFEAKGKPGFDKDCFIIVDNTYSNNISKGTAKVIVWGNPLKGYGGFKVISFKIQPRPIK